MPRINFSRINTIKASKKKTLSPEYLERLKSEEWKALKRKALERASYCCEDCGSAGDLDLHHENYESFGRETLEDVSVLCRECHDKADESGRVIRDRLFWERRVEGWATKKYGECWRARVSWNHVESELMAVVWERP